MKNKMEAVSYTLIVLYGASAAFRFPDLSVPLVWRGGGLYLCVVILTEQISVQSELGGFLLILEGQLFGKK